jgi:hypothetical protein
MFETLAVFAASMFFLPVLALLVLFTWIFAERESGWAVILTVAVGLLVFNGFPQLTEFFSHPTNVVATIAGYVVFGVLWAFTKWYMVLNKTKTKFITFRTNYLESKNFDAGYFSKPAPSASTLMKHTPEEEKIIKDHADYIEAIGKAFGNHSVRQPATVQDAIKNIRPLASRHKSSIMFWIGYWPFSVIWFLISDLVREFAEFVYNKIAGTFQRLSDRMFSNLA